MEFLILLLSIFIVVIFVVLYFFSGKLDKTSVIFNEQNDETNNNLKIVNNNQKLLEKNILDSRTKYEKYAEKSTQDYNQIKSAMQVLEKKISEQKQKKSGGLIDKTQDELEQVMKTIEKRE